MGKSGICLYDLQHTFARERVGLMALEELRALMSHANIQSDAEVFIILPEF